MSSSLLTATSAASSSAKEKEASTPLIVIVVRPPSFQVRTREAQSGRSFGGGVADNNTPDYFKNSTVVVNPPSRDSSVLENGPAPPYESLINFPRTPPAFRRGRMTAHCVMCGRQPSRDDSSLSLLQGPRTTLSEAQPAAISALKIRQPQEDSDLATAAGGGNNAPLNIVIRQQNKDVCTVCDSVVWRHLRTQTYVKWCKGCKRFNNLFAFTGRTFASATSGTFATKCDQCLARRRKKYEQQQQQQQQQQGHVEAAGDDNDSAVELAESVCRARHDARKWRINMGRRGHQHPGGALATTTTTVLPVEEALVASRDSPPSTGKKKRDRLARVVFEEEEEEPPRPKKSRPSPLTIDDCPCCLDPLDNTVVRLDCSTGSASSSKVHGCCGACFARLAALPSSRKTRAGAIVVCPLCRKHAKAHATLCRL